MYKQELCQETKDEWLQESIRESVKEWKKLALDQKKKPAIKSTQQFEALKKAPESVERKSDKMIDEEFEVIKPNFLPEQADP